MRILRLRCGNSSSGESNLQKRSQGPRVRFLSSPSDFIIIVDVLLGPFLHTIPPHDYLSSLRPSPPHHVCYFACDFRSKQPTIFSSSPLCLGTTSYSTFNDWLQSSFPYPAPIFHSLVITTDSCHSLFLFVYNSSPPFRTYVTRCHLEPPSIL